MPTLAPPSRVAQLAQTIEQDIRRRGLAAGDAYLTAAEVSEMLGVHLRMAGRAMQLLGRKRVLLRRRGVGTFIGPALPRNTPAVLRIVHVLVTTPRFTSGLATGEIITALREQMPGCDIQFNFIPAEPHEAPLEYVRQVVEHGAADGSLAGVVLISCPRPIQEYVLQQRIPAVVFGGVYPTTAALPSVDVDQDSVGRLMAEWLLKRGHKRIALLARELWLPGDNAIVDGISRAMAAARLGQGSLVIRSVAADASAIETEVTRVLDARDRPTAVICRSPRFVAPAQRAAESLNIQVGKTLEIVVDRSSDVTVHPSSIPFMIAEQTFGEQAGTVGRTLAAVIAGKPVDPLHVTVPVRMVDAR